MAGLRPIISVFNAHSSNAKDGLLANRELAIRDPNPLAAAAMMQLVRTTLENSPAPASMRIVSLALFFVDSSSFNLEEYLQEVCRILQLTTPNSLNLTCVLTQDGVSDTSLDTIRRILCPALFACDSLVHIGVRAPPLSPNLVDFVDDVLSATPSCHSLSVNFTARLVAEPFERVLCKRVTANVNDSRFHKITRMEGLCFKGAPSLERLGVELSRGLRVSNWFLNFTEDVDPEYLPEYVSLNVKDRSAMSRLVAALSNPASRIRGLRVLNDEVFPGSLAQPLGEAIVSGQIQEINLILRLIPTVLDAFAEGVSRSQLCHISISCGRGCDVEGALMKILECSTLRQLVILPPIGVTSLSKDVIGRILEHRALEYCCVGELLPYDAAYDRMCSGNFAKSTRLLTFLLLQWVGTFTELPAVDINLFRFIRVLMVMPIARASM